MKITRLQESAASDRRMRQMAANAVRGLVANRRRPFQPGVVWIMGKPKSVVWVSTIYPDLIVGFMLNFKYPTLTDLMNAETTIPSRYRCLIHYPLEGPPEAATSAGALRIARSIISKEKTLADDLLGDIREEPQDFVHEFTHYSDTCKSPHPIHVRYSALSNANRTYYNDPQERNAFYNQMLSRIDHRGQEFYQIGFPEFLKRVTRLFSGDFFTSLKRRNQQRIIQRLYGVWQAHQ